MRRAGEASKTLELTELGTLNALLLPHSGKSGARELVTPGAVASEAIERIVAFLRDHAPAP